MSNPVINWASENPLVAGVAAIGVVVVVMMLAGGGSSTTSGSDGGAVAAYYAAVGQQTQAGNAVQIAQIQANADTNKTLLAATYGLKTAELQAGVQTHAIDVTQQVTNQSNWYDWNNVQAAISSNERLGANTNVANVMIAQAQAKAQVDTAKANRSSNTAEKINAGSNLIGSIGKAASSIFKLF